MITTTQPAYSDNSNEFQNEPAHTSCELLSRGPHIELTKQEITLHNFLSEFLDQLKTGELDNFEKYFHSQAKGKQNIGDKIESILKNRYEKPWQFTLFRAWKISVPEGKKSILNNCQESENTKIITQFGHPRQFTVWIQIMSQNELGRLLISLAPEKASLKITGMRIQQWTQNGDDWEKWSLRAQDFIRSNNKKQAYIAYDVAQKLLSGGDLVIYPRQSLLWQDREKLMTQAQVLSDINQAAGVQSIAYVGSLLTKEGTGLLIREVTSPDLSYTSYKETCEQRGKSLILNGWIQKGQGLRCNYILKGMDPTADSALGGFYLNADDLKNGLK